MTGRTLSVMVAAIGLVAGAQAQTPPIDAATLRQAREALAAAEAASSQAKASADAAREAAREAEATLVEARRLMAALTNSTPPAPAAS